MQEVYSMLQMKVGLAISLALNLAQLSFQGFSVEVDQYAPVAMIETSGSISKEKLVNLY